MDTAANSNALAQAKREARAAAAVARAAIGRDRRAKAAMQIADMNIDFAPASGVSLAAYVAFRDELDPLALLTRLASDGASIALPCVIARGEPLVFRAWKPGDALAVGAHGIPAPGADAPLVVPRVVLVPLLAFDAQGYRLGYGGGYYDRTLAALRKGGGVDVIGLAFDEQEMPTVPHGARDQRLDRVLTPSGVREFETVRT